MRACSYAWSLPVTWQRWRHTIRSAIAKNPMLHANLMALCFTEPKLWPIEVLHCGNRDFTTFFCSYDLDLDPMTIMTFIYEIDPYSLAVVSPAMRHWGTCPPPSTSNNFIFSSLRSQSEIQLSKYCVVCEISWCRCQQLTALSISTALVTNY